MLSKIMLILGFKRAHVTREYFSGRIVLSFDMLFKVTSLLSSEYAERAAESSDSVASQLVSFVVLRTVPTVATFTIDAGN